MHSLAKLIAVLSVSWGIGGIAGAADEVDGLEHALHTLISPNATDGVENGELIQSRYANPRDFMLETQVNGETDSWYQWTYSGDWDKHLFWFRMPSEELFVTSRPTEHRIPGAAQLTYRQWSASTVGCDLAEAASFLQKRFKLVHRPSPELRRVGSGITRGVIRGFRVPWWLRVGFYAAEGHRRDVKRMFRELLRQRP